VTGKYSCRSSCCQLFSKIGKSGRRRWQLTYAALEKLSNGPQDLKMKKTARRWKLSLYLSSATGPGLIKVTDIECTYRGKSDDCDLYVGQVLTRVGLPSPDTFVNQPASPSANGNALDLHDDVVSFLQRHHFLSPSPILTYIFMPAICN
jgi:hypothetical protein